MFALRFSTVGETRGRLFFVCFSLFLLIFVVLVFLRFYSVLDVLVVGGSSGVLF